VSRSLKAQILLVLVTFAWGATFVSVKDALAVVSPLVFNTLRMASASLALLIVFRKELKQLNKPAALAGTLLGVLLWAGYSFQTVGLKLTTPSKSAFITGLAVVLVPIIVAISARRSPNRWTLLGVASALAGLYLMTIPASQGFSLASANRGDLITSGCSISFALHIFFLGRFTQRYPFKTLAVLQVTIAALLMAMTIPLETPRLAFTGQAVFAILFTGLVCTAAAFSIQAWAQQFTPPTHTALIFVLEPVFAALTSYVLLGERLGARGTIGAILILGGILISELKAASATASPAGGAEFSIN
jgi:drug/metabolite transporter (DMT)-like permease